MQTHFNVSVSHSEFVVEQTSSRRQSLPSSTSAIGVYNIVYMLVCYICININGVKLTNGNYHSIIRMFFHISNIQETKRTWYTRSINCVNSISVNKSLSTHTLQGASIAFSICCRASIVIYTVFTKLNPYTIDNTQCNINVVLCLSV